MENDLEAARRLCFVLDRFGEGLDDEDTAAAVMQPAEEIRQHVEAIEQDRCRLFRPLHPDRGRFEREGWPSDDKAADAEARS